MSQDVQDIKVVLMGESGVGKTAMVRFVITDTFLEEPHQPTITVSESVLALMVNQKAYRLQLWDTAGQERYRSLAPLYYRGVQAALVVYAVDDLNSFEMLDFWLSTLAEEASSNPVVFLVGNKIDLEKRAVSEQAGTEKAQALGVHFAEVSAKTGRGIRDLFSAIPMAIAEVLGKTEEMPVQREEIERTEKSSGCC